MNNLRFRCNGDDPYHDDDHDHDDDNDDDDNNDDAPFEICQIVSLRGCSNVL